MVVADFVCPLKGCDFVGTGSVGVNIRPVGPLSISLTGQFGTWTCQRVRGVYIKLIINQIS